MAELAQTFGLSRSTVFEHMRELRAKGLLETCPGKARSSMLTFPGQELLHLLVCHQSGVFAVLIPTITYYIKRRRIKKLIEVRRKEIEND